MESSKEKKNITYMELREPGLVTKTLALLSTATRRHSCPAVRAVLDHLSKSNNKTEKTCKGKERRKLE
jgi:predicted TIM-barrel fold metal-dependent hydrolase